MLPTWKIKQLSHEIHWVAETSVENTENTRSYFIPEPFLKVKVWLVGANSFGLEPQETYQINKENHNSMLFQNKGIYTTFACVLLINILSSPSFQSLCTPHLPSLRPQIPSCNPPVFPDSAALMQDSSCVSSLILSKSPFPHLYRAWVPTAVYESIATAPTQH